MRSLLFHRLFSVALAMMGLSAPLTLARADSALAPGTDESKSLSLRGGQIIGNQLRAYLYEASAAGPTRFIAKLDNIEQTAVTARSFKDAREPVDVLVLLHLAAQLRTPSTLKSIQTELNTLSAGIYEKLGGKMGLVAYNRGLSCIPQKGELAASKEAFATVVQSIGTWLPAKDQPDDGSFDIANALECATESFSGSPPGRAKTILLISDGEDKNISREQQDLFTRRANGAKEHSISVQMLLLPGDVQATPRKRQPFESYLCQATGGQLVDAKVEADLPRAFGDIQRALFDQVLLAGPLSLAGSSSPGQKRRLTLASGPHSMDFSVSVDPGTVTPPPIASPSIGPEHGRTLTSGPNPSDVVAIPIRRWLALAYVVSALFGGLLILFGPLRQKLASGPAVAEFPRSVTPVLAEVPKRPARNAKAARPAEWLGAATDRLPGGGMAWLYAPRTRRTHLLSPLPFRIGTIADSHVVLRLRGQPGGCEFHCDPQTKRMTAQPLAEQSVEIEGQRVSHAVELSDRVHIRISGEDFQFFQVCPGGEHVA